MNTLPLLFAGSAESRQRARATLDWVFSKAQTQSGLVVGVIYGAGGRELGDGFGASGTDRWVMTRKCGDLLYFLMKHLILLRRQGSAIPPAWLDGTRRLADRFVTIWRQYGQFGQLLGPTPRTSTPRRASARSQAMRFSNSGALPATHSILNSPVTSSTARRSISRGGIARYRIYPMDGCVNGSTPVTGSIRGARLATSSAARAGAKSPTC